jgi:hypothetical protein
MLAITGSPSNIQAITLVPFGIVRVHPATHCLQWVFAKSGVSLGRATDSVGGTDAPPFFVCFDPAREVLARVADEGEIIINQAASRQRNS